MEKAGYEVPNLGKGISRLVPEELVRRVVEERKVAMTVTESAPQ